MPKTDIFDFGTLVIEIERERKARGRAMFTLCLPSRRGSRLCVELPETTDVPIRLVMDHLMELLDDVVADPEYAIRSVMATPSAHREIWGRLLRFAGAALEQFGEDPVRGAVHAWVDGRYTETASDPKEWAPSRVWLDT